MSHYETIEDLVGFLSTGSARALEDNDIRVLESNSDRLVQWLADQNITLAETAFMILVAAMCLYIEHRGEVINLSSVHVN